MQNKIKMNKLFEVLPPMMPNFVRFKKEDGLRQDGFKVDEGFQIRNFTREEAEEYAEKEKHKNGRVDTTDDTKKCDFLNGHNSGGL